MIFYFSGTGNSRHVARRLAHHFGERALAIDDCLKREQTDFALSPGERLGLVFPVYFWGLPVPVRLFVERLTLWGEAPALVYDVVTYGTTIGASHGQLRQALRRRGWHLDRSFAVRMPDVWTPLFNLSNHDRCLRRCQRAERTIGDIIERIDQGRPAPHNFTVVPRWLAAPYYHTYERNRLTRHFWLIKDRCTGCGLCARRCPAGAIVPDDQGHPVWQSPSCYACLRCLHHCPTFAIQYGKHTAGHGQYVYPEHEGANAPTPHL